MQKTRSGESKEFPKVKKIYVPGRLDAHEVGIFKKRTGKQTYGIKITYTKTRLSYTRKPFIITRGGKKVHVTKAEVPASKFHYTKIVDLPTFVFSFSRLNLCFHSQAGEGIELSPLPPAGEG